MNDNTMDNNEATMVTTTVDIPADDLARARELGIDISAVVRSALTERLFSEALASEIEAYTAAFADWGPTEDWSDWTDVRE